MTKHIASLNLFQQPDGSYQITVAGGSMKDIAVVPGDVDLKPVDHIENRVLAAARNMQRRKRGDGTYRTIRSGD